MNHEGLPIPQNVKWSAKMSQVRLLEVGNTIDLHHPKWNLLSTSDNLERQRAK